MPDRSTHSDESVSGPYRLLSGNAARLMVDLDPAGAANRIVMLQARVVALERAGRDLLGAIEDAWDGSDRSPLWGLGDSLEAALDTSEWSEQP